MGINEKMTSIANGLRTLSSTSGPMGLDAMSEKIATANTTINEQSDLITQIKEALKDKGTAEGGTSKPVLIDSGSCGSDATWEFYSDGRFVVNGTGNVYDYTSSTLGGWSSYKSDITEVVINEGITSIGDYFCYKFSKAIKVTLPNTIETIGDWSFTQSGLVSIDIPDSVTSIGNGAFYYCKSLRTVNIPDGVTIIGEQAFQDCTNLTNINIPDSVTVLGPHSLRNTDNLTSIAIGNGITTINIYTFHSCGNLTSIIIPNSVTTIDGNAFGACPNLTTVFYKGTKSEWEAITIGNGNDVLFDNETTLYCEYEDVPVLEAQEKPVNITTNGITEVEPDENKTLSKVIINVNVPTGGGSGNGDTDKLMGIIDGTISEFYIPDNVTAIRPGLFYDCNNLTTALIPSHITSIGADAFKSCDGLIGVKFDGDIANFDATAFSDCSNITDIYVPWLEGAVAGAPWGATNATVHYDCNASDIIMNSVLYISPNTTEIPNDAYKGRQTISELIVPDSVTKIGSNAFTGSTLEKITLGNGVILISSNAFTRCTKLTSITIPNSVTTISSGVFYNCTGLINATIGTSVTSIGTNAFKDCKSLKKITIGSAVSTIAGSAFLRCTALTDVYYAGTEEQWNAIVIGKSNEPLLSATIHYNIPM